MHEKINAYLVDWAEHFFRSRDAFHKRIQSMKKEGSNLIITYLDRTETVRCSDNLEGCNDLAENMSVVTLNNRRNVEDLYRRWPDFKKLKTLKVYFINPFSMTDTKWIIAPSVHARICDESSLKLGLMAMFEAVEPVTVEIFETKLQAQQ